MCYPASFVLTKTKIFWSKFCELHEIIIDENKLCPDGLAGANVVRVEITPPRSDWALPVEEWNFALDQLNPPEWYDRDEVYARVLQELPRWYESKIILTGSRDFVRDHVVCIGGDATVECIEDRAKVGTICGRARIVAIRGSAEIGNIYGAVNIRSIYGNVHIDSIGGTCAVCCIDERVKITTIAAGAVVDHVTGEVIVIDLSRSARIGELSGMVRVQRLMDYARIDTMKDHSVVSAVYGFASIGSMCGQYACFYTAFSCRLHGETSVIVDAHSGPYRAHMSVDRERIITNCEEETKSNV